MRRDRKAAKSTIRFQTETLRGSVADSDGAGYCDVMPDLHAAIAELAHDLVTLDSRSFVSNLPVAERIEAELTGFQVERLDYHDQAGVAKRVLVAHRAGSGGIAFSGHMDTVPETGWQDDPWSGLIDENGLLHGLGSTDMKGPLAAAIIAARGLAPSIPVTLLVTTDEESTKQGARVIADRSDLVRAVRPQGILVVEPTGLSPVRGHRSHIVFTCVATGLQAHSSTGRGRNANWDLIPFLAEMKTVLDRLHADPSLQDADYDPPFSDFNLVIDNHGTAMNVTVPVATARIKFRYSAKIDPTPIQLAVRNAADRHGVAVTEAREGKPPELPADHPFVQLCANVVARPAVTVPFGTDASELQAIAPCVILGPGTINVAHKPNETVRIADLVASVPVFQSLANRSSSA